MTRQADEQKSMNTLSGGSHVEKVSEMRKYDQAAVQERMTKLRAEVAQKKDAEAKRAAELEAVKVEPADVALVASELELTDEEALRRLREKKGDAVAVLREAVGLPKAK